MMKLYGLLVVCFAMAALLFFGTSKADEIRYDLDRMIVPPNSEVIMPEGDMIIYDNGAYSPIEHIILRVSGCSDLTFSPAPICDHDGVFVNAGVSGYSLGGGRYYLDDGTELVFAVRGSLATGYPKAVIYLDGIMYVFRQHVD